MFSPSATNDIVSIFARLREMVTQRTVVSGISFKYNFDETFEKKNLKLISFNLNLIKKKLISFVLHVIVNIRVKRGTPILLQYSELVVIAPFDFVKAHVQYNYNLVYGVNLRKRITANCYYFLPFQTNL